MLILFLLSLPLVTPRLYAVDSVEYLVYLPSLLFDGDLDFSDEYTYFMQLNPQAGIDAFVKYDPTTGLPLNVAPVGTALLWSPAYLLTHAGVLLARALGAPLQADGLSRPYILAVCYASTAYAFAGLLLAYRLCRQYVSAFAAALAVALVWLATPAFFYSHVSPPWSHSASLFTVALFVTVWHNTREGRTPAQFFFLGLLGGLMTMVREQDGFFLLIPALEGLLAYVEILRHGLSQYVGGICDPPDRCGCLPGQAQDLPLHPKTVHSAPAEGGCPPGQAQGLPLHPKTVHSAPAEGGCPPGQAQDLPLPHGSKRQWPALGGLLGRHVLLLIGVGLALSPQLAAYRVLNGRFGPNPTVGGKFDWHSPHFFQVLGDPQYGLLVWSPLLLLALLGLFLLLRRDRLLAFALGSAFLSQVYLTGAFLTWQSPGSFGQRRFVNCTIIFALGLAVLIARLRDKGWPAWTLLGLGGLFVAWNAGLVAHWALYPADREAGLLWDRLPHRVLLEIPRRVDLLRRLLFERHTLYENQGN